MLLSKRSSQNASQWKHALQNTLNGIKCLPLRNDGQLKNENARHVEMGRSCNWRVNKLLKSLEGNLSEGQSEPNRECISNDNDPSLTLIFRADSCPPTQQAWLQCCTILGFGLESPLSGLRRLGSPFKLLHYWLGFIPRCVYVHLHVSAAVMGYTCMCVCVSWSEGTVFSIIHK